jgi:hypothetical protein
MGGTDGGDSGSAQRANLDATVSGCQHEASVQVENAAALDAKLLGILAFMGAVAGVLLTVAGALHSYRWILLAGASAAIVVSLLGLLGGDDPKSGPNPIEFYDKYGGAQPEAFSGQLVGEFRRTLQENKGRLEMRQSMVALSAVAAIGAGVVFGVARALVAILA